MIVAPSEHFVEAAAMGDVPLAISSAFGASRMSRRMCESPLGSEFSARWG